MSKYRIDEEKLHKKQLEKHTLYSRVVGREQATLSYAGEVFHYTSPEGLMGILGNREIFFTDAQFLNDYSERFNINDELKYFWDTHYKQYDKEFYKLLRNIEIRSYEDNTYAYIGEESIDEPYRYYVLSTSVNRDSLSMWKYYAKNGTYDGYNISLFIPALVDEWIDRETGVSVEIGLVIYETVEKQKKIHLIVEELYKLWCIYGRSEDLDMKIIKEYNAWISFASLFFKNDCFSSEEEMRFVAIVPKSKLNNIYYERIDGTKVKMYDFRNVNGIITPYIKMPLFGWNVSENWITSSIGVGPCLDFEQKEKGIIQFVKSLEYSFHELRVIESGIPLRY